MALTEIRRDLIRHLCMWSSAFFLAGCEPGFEKAADGDDGEEPDAPALVYQGAGSFWRMELDQDDDFELSIRPRPNGTLSTSLRGEVETLNSGYSRLRISSSSGDNPPSNRESLAAVGVAEDVLLLRDWRENGRVVPFVSGDACPQGEFTVNWIEWTTPSGNRATSDSTAFFGVARLDPGAGQANLVTRFALTEQFPEQSASGLFSTGTCNKGIARAGSDHTFFGENGTALLHRNIGSSQESLLLGLPKASITNADLDGRYRGFWIDSSRSPNDRLWYLTLECTSGDCAAQRINDITDLNRLRSENFRIELDLEALDEPTSGFVTGSSLVTVSSFETYSGQISCVASDDFTGSGEKLLACVGQAPRNPQAAVHGFFVANE